VTSIKRGTVTASPMLRKLSSYPRQNGLAVAPWEIGQIERTLSPWTGCRTSSCAGASTPGSTKARRKTPWRAPSLSAARARSVVAASSTGAHRASGLNLVVAPSVLWNTAYLHRSVQVLKEGGQTIDEALLRPLLAGGMGAHQRNRRLRLPPLQANGNRRFPAAATSL